jgi:hypothetical protein
MALRVGKRQLLLALCVFAASFGVTLAAVVVVRHQATARPLAPVAIRGAATGALAPAQLDRQWVVYSDQSTCADRAAGDGVSAVRLNRSQIAWFFSDSSLGPAGPRIGLSEQSGFVHNLVVMQTTDDSRSTLVTITGGDACAGPGQLSRARSVVSPADAGGVVGQRYWAGDGLRTGSRVLHFYSRFLPGALVPVGTVIASFAVRQLAREGRGPQFGAAITPAITTVPAYVPPDGGTPIAWGAALLRRGATVYVYGWQSPVPRQPARRWYLARVAVSRLTDVATWRFYAGPGRWVAGQRRARPIKAGAGVAIETGFSVLRAGGRYWLIEQAGGVGGQDIDAYPGRTPWGPFDGTAGLVLYRAAGIGLTGADDYQVMYGAQAEPALSSKRMLLISYNVNSLAVTAGCEPLSAFTNSVIQPRFIAVPRAVFGDFVRTARSAAVATGPAPDPPAIGRRVPRWYDSWKYRGGCPPLRAVTHLAVTRANGRIQVHWAAAGPGVRYLAYLRSGGRPYALLAVTRAASVTLPRLAPGRRYQVRIVPENVERRAGPGVTALVTVR